MLYDIVVGAYYRLSGSDYVSGHIWKVMDIHSGIVSSQAYNKKGSKVGYGGTFFEDNFRSNIIQRVKPRI